MRAMIKFLRETKLWILMPGLVVVFIVVLLGLILASPMGAFIYTLF